MYQLPRITPERVRLRSLSLAGYNSRGSSDLIIWEDRPLSLAGLKSGGQTDRGTLLPPAQNDVFLCGRRSEKREGRRRRTRSTHEATARTERGTAGPRNGPSGNYTEPLARTRSAPVVTTWAPSKKKSALRGSPPPKTFPRFAHCGPARKKISDLTKMYTPTGWKRS